MLTSFAQVRSSGFVFEKILSKKLYSSRSICGRRRTEKETERNLGRSLKDEANLPTKHDGMDSTRRVQNAPCPIDGQEVRLPGVAHPTVSLQEEVAALPVVVGVRGLVDNFQDGLPGDEAVHSPRFVYLVRTVAMKELPYGQ